MEGPAPVAPAPYTVATGVRTEVAVKPVKARYLRLTSLAEINGREWASISELQVAGEDGQNLPREGWAATASNSETQAKYDTSARCVIDGDPVTWWFGHPFKFSYKT